MHVGGPAGFHPCVLDLRAACMVLMLIHWATRALLQLPSEFKYIFEKSPLSAFIQSTLGDSNLQPLNLQSANHWANPSTLNNGCGQSHLLIITHSLAKHTCQSFVLSSNQITWWSITSIESISSHFEVWFPIDSMLELDLIVPILVIVALDQMYWDMSFHPKHTF